MAIESMQKARIAIHKSVSDDLIDRIQRLGCCQFIPTVRDGADESALAPLKARLRELDDLLADARFVTRFFEPFATEKGGGMAVALGDAPEYSMSQLEVMASGDRFTGTVAEARSLEKKLSDARSGASRASGLIAQLMPLSGLPYSLDFYNRGTERISGSLLSVHCANTRQLEVSCGEKLGDQVEFFVLPAPPKSETNVVSVLYPREKTEAFQEILAGLAGTGHQAARVDVPPQLSGTAEREIASLEAELAGFKEQEAVVTEDITASANVSYKLCQCLTDYWNIRKAKLESLLSGEQTEQITVLSFWIPKGALGAFKEAAADYESLIEVVYVEPEEGETPPTLMRNKAFFEPVEPLVSMFGTPAYGVLDPTSIVAVFFYMFFGICFGDAAYGLLVAAVLIWVMMKKQIRGTLRKFMLVMIIGNICAVIFGTLTFSWFGDSITSFSFLRFLMPLQKFQVLDPMNDPMTMLYVSLAFGFVQIMIGLVLAFYGNFKKGEVFAALADQGGWILFLCSLVLFGLSSAGVIGVSAGVFKATAGLGAVILVATQGRSKTSVIGKLFSGILSLYNVSGYLGDLLSYSRLLALGLCSAAVGVVVNLLANLVSGVPYVGIILALLIFVLGHSFSIAVNILGAFVHSLRLQYVEFFGKFYDGSGAEFTPLSVATQYVKISK
jgi:V/A-type H+-transporting ATPase subunit I